MTIQLKTCACCKQALDVSSFGKDSHRADGLRSYCRKCWLIKSRQSHANNREKDRARNKEWREINPEANRLKNECWQQSNRDKYAQYAKNWRDTNPDLNSAKTSRQRAIRLQRMPLYASSPEHQALIKQVYAQAQARGWHVDHVIPLQGELVSGLHCWANLQVLAPVENLSKSNKFAPGDI